MNKNLQKVLIFIMMCVLALLIYKIVDIYAVFHSEVEANVELKNGVWNVTVNGTQNHLKDYKLPQGFLYVDCSWITEPGEYELEVQNYKLSNLNLVSVEPNTISVTISEKKQEEVSEENVDLEEDITSENSQTEEVENVSSENQLSETTNQEISE